MAHSIQPQSIFNSNMEVCIYYIPSFMIESSATIKTNTLARNKTIQEITFIISISFS